jgi:seryl-tRNA(Sec) selenium transferase
MAAAAAGPSVYEREFGVVPIVNCIGTFTSLGGSRMHPDAVRGVSEAAGHFVDMNKLYEAAGEKVARMTAQPDTHSAHITNGAAAAIALLSAALLTGEDPARVTQLPSLEGIARHEIVIDGHDEHDGHTRWMMAAKLTGARVVQVGRVGAPMTAAGLRAALGTGRVMLVLVFENVRGRSHLDPCQLARRSAHAQVVAMLRVCICRASRPASRTARCPGRRSWRSRTQAVPL